MARLIVTLQASLCVLFRSRGRRGSADSSIQLNEGGPENAIAADRRKRRIFYTDTDTHTDQQIAVMLASCRPGNSLCEEEHQHRVCRVPMWWCTWLSSRWGADLRVVSCDGKGERTKKEAESNPGLDINVDKAPRIMIRSSNN